MTTKADHTIVSTGSVYGLTKREYFAGLAMQAMISASGGSNGDVEYDEEVVAANAVVMADALIKALNDGE